MGSLRRGLASIPEDRAIDLVNGMFFEVYFNSSGEFRGRKLKVRCLEKLLSLQTVSKFLPSIRFIRRALEPYQSSLIFLPNSNVEIVNVIVELEESDLSIVKSLMIREKNLLTSIVSNDDMDTRLWRLPFRGFTIDELRQQMVSEWGVPSNQLKFEGMGARPSHTKLRLADGVSVIWPMNM